MNKGRISIIAPCYNGESYVGAFLDSVLKQTYDNVELILVNDGSTDNTEAILKDYEEKFKERGYEYVHLKQENKGIGGALNDALKYVTGEYMTWFGTDDIMFPEYACELVDFLDNNEEYAVVRCEGYIVDKNDFSKIIEKMAGANHDKHNPYLFENAILERNFQFGYSVVRMSVFDKVNPKREIYPSREGQNWQLLLPIFYAHKSAFYEKPLYYVLYDENSVSRVARKSYERVKLQNDEYERILNNVVGSMDIPDKEKYLKMIKVKYIRRRMRAAIDYSNKADAKAEYRKLKSENAVEKEDKRRYLGVKFPLLKKIKKKFSGK